MLQYTLIRSRRKTLAIHITKDGTVEIRASLKMPKADIDKLVVLQDSRILSYLSRHERLKNEKNAFVLNYGDIMTLCGKGYPIRAESGKSVCFDGEYFNIPPGLPQEDIKNAVVKIYKTEAKRILKDKVDEYAFRMKVRPTNVKINNAKTRWGSCSGKNSINFSWRLVMADESAIGYVVAHELAHIREHNHSPRFWAVVEGVMPDYTQRRFKLKALQEKLSRENWD